MLIELADGNSSPHANVINEHKMKKSTWRKHHKWLGLICAFFLIMFALSGLVLNHPRLFASVNVSRSLLPASYRYTQWNRGLLKGTLKWRGKVLIYGNNGKSNAFVLPRNSSSLRWDNMGSIGCRPMASGTRWRCKMMPMSGWWI